MPNPGDWAMPMVEEQRAARVICDWTMGEEQSATIVICHWSKRDEQRERITIGRREQRNVRDL